ncbi:MAG: YciI family protein [Negativicutes bacterium]|nr:YciI family protein [Negativicutes bacterium]
MAKFVFIIKDKDPAVLTKELYHRHIAHLKQNARAEKLFLVGPLKDQDKILQVVQADSPEEARAVVDSDPYVSAGLYQAYECYELLESNEANNWLADTPRVQEMLRGLK